MRAVLASTAGYLRGRGLDIAPQTRAAAEAFELPLASVSENRLETAQRPSTPPQRDAVA
jgi:hypothetical protein